MTHQNQVHQSQNIETQVQADVAFDYAAPVELLPEPPLATDPLAAFGELLIELRIEDRGRARLENRAEEERIQHEGKRQLDAIRARGDAQFTQALVSGAFQVASGAAKMYGGFTAEGAADLQKYDGLSKVFDAGATIGEGITGNDVNAAELSLTAAETAEATAERRAEEARSDMQAAQDDTRALLGALQRIYDADVAAQKAAVFVA